MNILREPQSQRLLVIASEKTDALTADGVKEFIQLLEARVGKVVETWEKGGVHTFNVEPFVGDVDTLRIVANSYPDRVVKLFYLRDGVTKCIQIAGPSAKMDVSDRKEYEGIRAGLVASD